MTKELDGMLLEDLPEDEQPMLLRALSDFDKLDEQHKGIRPFMAYFR